MTRDHFKIIGLIIALSVAGYTCKNNTYNPLGSDREEVVNSQAAAGELPNTATAVKRNFTAHLDGESGMLAAGTKARGEAIFHISKDGMSISYKLIISNIENVLMAQIRVPSGEEGDNVDEHGDSNGGCNEDGGCEDEGGDEGCGGHEGGEPGGGSGHKGQGCQVAVWLYPAGGPPTQLIENRFEGILVEGTITAGDLWGPLRGKELNALITIIREGGAYVLVATSQYHGYDGGEIRGPIK